VFVRSMMASVAIYRAVLSTIAPGIQWGNGFLR
jgi:hypothetical protein